MPATKGEIIKIFQDQIEIEKQAIKTIQEASDNSKNTAIKLLLQTIVYDSMEHQNTYQVMIEIASGRFILESEKKEIKKDLADHIALEKKALDNLNKLQGKLDDPLMTCMIQNMIKDENNHHKFLNELVAQPNFCGSVKNVIDVLSWVYPHHGEY